MLICTKVTQPRQLVCMLVCLMRLRLFQNAVGQLVLRKVVVSGGGLVDH